VSRPRKKQFVGNKQTVNFKGENVRCKIILPSAEKRDENVAFGEIRFEQDFGFIIDIYEKNGKKNEDDFIKITDGLEIEICEFKLTFKMDGSDNDSASKDGGVIAGTDKPAEEKAKSGETEGNHGEADGTTGEGAEVKEDNAEAKEHKEKEDKKPGYKDILKSGVIKILESFIEWLRNLSGKLGGK